MSGFDEFPGVSSFLDRHGKRRWRYRARGKTTSLPPPDDPGFAEAYQAAVEGRAPRKAAVTRLPTAALPETFGAAWRLVLASPEWTQFDPATKMKNLRLAEGFLLAPIVQNQPELWRDVPVRDFRRRHMKQLLTATSATPTKGKHLLTTIRKMMTAALDEEWIEHDPTLRLGWRPETVGWKAWTREAMERYEAHWSPGTAARTAYALALWLGNRRADVAAIGWRHMSEKRIMLDGQERVIPGFEFAQDKGGKVIFLPVTPMLEEALVPLDRTTATILTTAYSKPFSAKSLTGAMANWTRLAGIEAGSTLHGLRKSLGVYLAEADATTRQIMEALGHDDIEHAELYSRQASQVRLAVTGMDKVVRLVRRG